jgi:hypothetical protein
MWNLKLDIIEVESWMVVIRGWGEWRGKGKANLCVLSFSYIEQEVLMCYCTVGNSR